MLIRMAVQGTIGAAMRQHAGRRPDLH